jgi:hypothetical protein
MVGRAGRTIVMSPVILGQTVTGQRKFISKHGLFTRDEEQSEKENASRSQHHPLFRGE